MKLTFFLLFIVIAACSSSEKTSLFPQLSIKSDQNSWLDGCSMIDTTLSEVWILLCKKTPHQFRPELYEYSPLFKTSKRLTFQDGLISDFVVTNVEDIIYSSTYDESKEQFLAIANGAQAGTDLYLKNRSQNDFTRITRDLGSDQHLFWSKETQSLIFSHSNPKGSQIRQRLKDKKVMTLVNSSSEDLYSPITLNDQYLYWLTWNSKTQKSSLQKKKLNTAARPTQVFQSATRVLMIRPSFQPEEILVTFSSGLGTELWAYGIKDECWKPLLQTQSKWNRFSLIENDSVYITENEQLRKVDLNKTQTNCIPHPTGLGVVK